ncbi:MAG: hypothetical protein HYV18_05325 [Gammaproteobacteria bacterium]|nr:hypothetical protein [Gammaproteobacteria bacterium]
MIAKTRGNSRRKKKKEPLEVQVTLRFNYGDEPDDGITVLDRQRVPMVGSVFEYRDRIFHAFTRLFIRTSLAQPKVVRELFPIVQALRRK